MMTRTGVEPCTEADRKACEEVIRKGSSSFYAAFSNLPPRKAAAVFAIYSFCRTADDIVDEQADEAALSKLALDFEEMLIGNVPDSPVFRCLSSAFGEFGLDPLPFRHMLEGLKSDLSFAQPRDMEDLLGYCYKVAGTVGLMLLPVIATENKAKLTGPAVDLGNAMQLTNIIRDISEDALRGRVYIPEDMLSKHGLTASDLLTGRFRQRALAAAMELADKADELYLRAGDAIPLYDEEARLPVLLAHGYYSGILVKARGVGEGIFDRRVYVDDEEKKLYLAAALKKAAQLSGKRG